MHVAQRAVARYNNMKTRLPHRALIIKRSTGDIAVLLGDKGYADRYGQRSQNETVKSRIKCKYGAFVRSQHWWNQFREIAIVYLTYNLDRSPELGEPAGCRMSTRLKDRSVHRVQRLCIPER
jgi:hypothetical protein